MPQYQHVAAITPSDTTTVGTYDVEITGTTSYSSLTAKAFMVGTTGDVAVTTQIDPATAVTISSVAAGVVIPLGVVKIMATNTTADGIVVFY